MEGKRESFELLTVRLYDAALEGDVPSLLNLLQSDPFILDRCSIEKLGRFTQSTLHVAAKFGHLEFVKEIIRRKPRLVDELDHTQGLSPLHVSSENGHKDIVKELLGVNPNMCLARDQDGRNPVHVAAMKGHKQVLEELLRVKPQAAREQTNNGETALHLCVKYDQLETLKLLVHETADGELLNCTDNYGNTVLHLAVMGKQPEIIKFLEEEKRMDKNVINKNGSTVLDICEKNRNDSRGKKTKPLSAKDASRLEKRKESWSENHRDILQVVASLIATMAFQAATNPPGGVWQDDKKGKDGHKAGLSVMAHHPSKYRRFMISNTIAFFSSLSVILLVISGFRYSRYFVKTLMLTMWIAVSAAAYAYMAAVYFLSSATHEKKDMKSLWETLYFCLYGWMLLMAFILTNSIIRITQTLIRKVKWLKDQMATKFGARTTDLV